MNRISPAPNSKPALVIVDDEESILTSLRSLFRKDGYSIYLFSLPNQALEFLEKNTADVIISDMRMPLISGTQLLERSLKICPNAIKIIISGYEEKSLIFNAISSGLARHYIMKPWDDDQLRSIVKESMSFQQKLRDMKLQELLHSFRNLPSPPRLHNKLKELLQNDQISQKEIAREIEKNPVLTANLLRMANSIFYGSRKCISDIFDALTFIGTESVLNILLSLEAFDCLSWQATPLSMRIAESLRIASVKRAQVAREIALKWEHKIDAQEAYVAGLMLDIGFILRCCTSPEPFIKFYEFIMTREKPCYLADKDIFKTTHEEVGEALLSYWNFSSRVITAVRNHHSHTLNDDLTVISQLADYLVQGEDSYPNDPCIEEYAKKWRVELNDLLNKMN